MSGNVKYPVLLGVDLTSTEAKPSACVGLDKSQLVYLGFLSHNTDIIGLADFYSRHIGMELRTSLGHDQKQAGQVIEIYPFAGKVRLFGRNVPRKTTKQGVSFLRDGLGESIPNLKPYLGMMNHDLCYAAVAAYTGLLHHQSRAEALGDRTEGLSFIPD